MRLRCKVFGCTIEEFGACCDRCQAYIYDTFVHQEQSWFAPIYNLIWKWKQNRWKRYHLCKVCDSPMFYTEDSCCSEDCYKCWDEVPF